MIVLENLWHVSCPEHSFRKGGMAAYAFVILHKKLFLHKLFLRGSIDRIIEIQYKKLTNYFQRKKYASK